jgi:predicted amidohydrolase
MKIALCINLVTNDRDANLGGISRMAREATAAGAEVVVFGETAITGMINNDGPAHDLSLGDAVPGTFTHYVAALA